MKCGMSLQVKRISETSNQGSESAVGVIDISEGKPWYKVFA
ncbi:hypothetical protein AD30_5081 [Escherichia coli 2-316-03_S4_C3]|nr:hypothetical protein CSC22_4059 [Escherichia coli]EYE08797.1 hypothetical protein AC80_5645 [Escherichia coli 1-110-08_S4_C1]KDY14094.1 hypothetical protein AD30_5081 [Escherichia coli 2-316-03_S4_C3]